MTTALADGTDLDHALREFERWRLTDAEYSHATWAGEKPGLLQFIDCQRDLGIHAVEAVTPESAAQWKETQARLGESTRATRLSQLRVFFGYCVKRGWIDADPTVLLRAPRPTAAPRERLTASELLELIDAADFPMHRLVLALAANLGIRQAEIKTLRIRDVNLDAGTILVTVHKTRTKTVPDLMPITQELAAELNRWLAHYQREAVLTQDTLLVPSQHYTPISCRVTYRIDRSVAEPEEIVKRGLAKLGWDVVKGEGIHTVRRSMARIFFDAAEAEVSYYDALLGTMRLLHHDRPDTTLRYIGVDRQTQARDNFLRGKAFLSRFADAPMLRIAQ